DLADRPKQRDVAAKIGHAARGLNAIVGDVLTFAREMTPRHDVADGRAMLERALEACADVARSVPGGVSIEWTGDAEPSLWCDPSLVERAIINVVRNALEAMGEVGGR